MSNNAVSIERLLQILKPSVMAVYVQTSRNEICTLFIYTLSFILVLWPTIKIIVSVNSK